MQVQGGRGWTPRALFQLTFVVAFVSLGNMSYAEQPTDSVWNRFIGDSRIYSSKEGTTFSFQFHDYLVGPDGKKAYARWVAANAEHPVAIEFSVGVSPDLFLVDDTVIRVRDINLLRKFEQSSWNLAVDGYHLSGNCLSEPGSQPGGVVHLDARSAFNALVEPGVTEVRHFSPCQMAILSIGDEGTVELQRRTPNDERSLGSAFLRLEATSFDGRLRLRVDGLTKDSPLDVFHSGVTIPDRLDVPKRSLAGVQDAVIRRQPVSVGFEMWASLDPIVDDRKIERINTDWDGSFRFGSDMVKLSQHLNRFCLTTAESVCGSDDNILPIDDFSVRQCRTERALGQRYWFIWQAILPTTLEVLSDNANAGAELV